MGANSIQRHGEAFSDLLVGAFFLVEQDEHTAFYVAQRLEAIFDEQGKLGLFKLRQRIGRGVFEA